MSLSIATKKVLTAFFKHLGQNELSVEKKRQKLASMYDFEPYSAFCRLDADGDKELFTIDFYNFLQQNGRKNISIKDC